MKIKLVLFVLIIVLSGLFSGFYYLNDSLRKIESSGQLVVITDNSAHGFYYYQDRPMGFEYQMAKKFADFLNVKLVVITPGWDNMFNSLLCGKGDIIASSLTKTERRKTRVMFSDGYMPVQQQVI